MFGRIRMTMLAAATVGAVFAGIASSAHAGLLSLTTGDCGLQASQPFAQWGDFNSYTLVPGGSFESGSPSWTLLGNAQVTSGNESYYVSGPGTHSLNLLPASAATSPPACTGLDHPTLRFFVRNTGSPSARLDVFATYPTLLGDVTLPAGEVSGSSSWEPSPALQLTLWNVVGSLSLNESTVSFTFVPVGAGGDWNIDDVYLDPFCKG